MNSIKQQISVIVGLLCIAGALGCHAIKASASGKENPYAKVIMPTTEMTNVTFLEAIDRLVAIHRDLRQKHMESHDDHKWCGGFPGLHFIVRPLSNEANNRRWSFRFENASMAEAFEAVACKFGLKLSYEEGAFADGYAIFEDPNYDTEPMPALGPSDDPFAGPEK